MCPFNRDPLGHILMFSGPLRSTETVLVQALNGPNVNADSYWVPVSVDLANTFDMVDHNTLAY